MINNSNRHNKYVWKTSIDEACTTLSFDVMIGDRQVFSGKSIPMGEFEIDVTDWVEAEYNRQRGTGVFIYPGDIVVNVLATGPDELEDEQVHIFRYDKNPLDLEYIDTNDQMVSFSSQYFNGTQGTYVSSSYLPYENIYIYPVYYVKITGTSKHQNYEGKVLMVDSSFTGNQFGVGTTDFNMNHFYTSDTPEPIKPSSTTETDTFVESVKEIFAHYISTFIGGKGLGNLDPMIWPEDESLDPLELYTSPVDNISCPCLASFDAPYIPSDYRAEYTGDNIYDGGYFPIKYTKEQLDKYFNQHLRTPFRLTFFQTGSTSPLPECEVIGYGYKVMYLYMDNDPTRTGSTYSYRALYTKTMVEVEDYSKLEWVSKIWNMPYITGNDIWYDALGTVYYSGNDIVNPGINYVLVDGNWVNKTWNIDLPRKNRFVWHYGSHTYYNQDEYSYELIGGQWVPKAWNKDISENGGMSVWHNGSHTYYNSGNKSYELINGQWVDKHWNDEYIDGYYVWHDHKGKTYASKYYFGRYYKLVDGNWENMIWNVELNPAHIWTTKDHTYYSEIASGGNVYYELINEQWVEITWDKVNGGGYIWHYDGHTYHSLGPQDSSYELNEPVEVCPYMNLLVCNSDFKIVDNGVDYYDFRVPLIVSNGTLKGKTINNLDKITWMNKYSDIHNGSVSNKIELECYIDSDWLKTTTKLDKNYAGLIAALQSSRETYLLGNANISGLDMEGDTYLKCRVKDVEKIETWSRYNSTNRIPSFKITIEIYR